MDTLVEMIKALSQYRMDNIRVLAGIKQPTSQITEFYEGIKKGELTSDTIAADVLLHCSPSSQSYKNLKVKLRNRIINTVFFINPQKLKINRMHNQMATQCYKKWMAAKLLNSIGAKGASIELSKQVLKEARKAEITHLIAEIAMYLRFHYGSLIGDAEKFEFYNKLFHRYNDIRNLEAKAQEHYIQLALYYAKSKADKSAIHEKAQLLYEELEASIYQYKTYKLIFFGGLIKLIVYMSKNDYKKSTDVCKETLELLDTNPLFPSLGKATFYHQQLICCIQLKQFNKGEELVKEALNFLKPGFYNWFRHQELFFLLSTHTRNYQRAYEVVLQTKSTKGFNGLDEKSKEIWKIYEMYTNYLILQGKVAGEKSRSIKIRLGKFLNEVPSYSQDKRGMNIAILIIQILLSIEFRQYDQAIDRFEAIEKYCSRYLKKDNNYRSNCFIKMLLQIPIARFHPTQAMRKANKFYDKLKACSIDIANQAHSIEIVPYEDLWEIVIESLEKRKKRR